VTQTPTTTTAAALQSQARALGDPTRHAIFRYVADAGGAADIAGLTAHLGLNHNAIRQHLAKLLAAGLVEEAKAPRTGPGRPRLVYRVAPTADSRWGVVGPYERLAVLLAEVLRTGDTPEDVGRRFAHRAGLAGSSDDPVERVEEGMARQGFAPTIRSRGGRVEIVLETCPFASAALTDADSVCRIHLGMAEGLAELTGGQVVVDELVAHDPRRASCRLRLHDGDQAPGDAAPEIRFTRRRGAVPSGRAGDAEGPGR
jgi:predicted ArsR family transcriptional regulator